MSKENLKINLPSYDSIFTTQKERDDEKAEKIQLIPIDKIKDFPNHPFRVERDEKMEEMVNSIKNEDDSAVRLALGVMLLAFLGIAWVVIKIFKKKDNK
nr:hypothetical protein [Clostridia bacterium]